VIDLRAVTPVGVEICMAGKIITYVTPSILLCEKHRPVSCLPALWISADYGETMHEHAVLSLGHLSELLFLAQMKLVSANYVSFVNGFSHRCFFTIIHTKPLLNRYH
jgi:hypothetical protein